MKKLIILFVIIIFLISCGGSKEPARFEMNGKEVQFLKSFSKFDKRDSVYIIEATNLTTTTCEDVLKRFRSRKQGEIRFKIMVKKDSSAAGIKLGMYSLTGYKVKAELVKKPIKVGDITEIALDELDFEVKFGDFKGKKVIALGLFKGQYCGEN